MDYAYVIAHQGEIYQALMDAEETKKTKTRRGPCHHEDHSPIEDLRIYLGGTGKGGQDEEMKSDKEEPKDFSRLVGYRSTTEDQRWLMVAFRYGSFE